jgi:hypothetical protein
MHSKGLRTKLDNIFTLTQALCDAHSMENIHGVDSLAVKDRNKGHDSSGAGDHTTSLDT